jgi:hypothetical protein
LRDFPPPAEQTAAALDWVAGPVSLSGESERWEQRNFDSLLDLLGEQASPENWTTALFFHWHSGWVESVFVRPDSDAVPVLAEMAERVARTCGE